MNFSLRTKAINMFISDCTENKHMFVSQTNSVDVFHTDFKSAQLNVNNSFILICIGCFRSCSEKMRMNR